MIGTARLSAGVAAVALVLGALQLVAPRADAAPAFEKPTGTRGLGSSYVVLWVSLAPEVRDVRSVKIGGRWATLRDGYWETVDRGTHRALPVRRVVVHTKTASRTFLVRFTTVEDW